MNHFNCLAYTMILFLSPLTLHWPWAPMFIFILAFNYQPLLFYIRPQGIMLQILLIMLFQISLQIPHYAHYYSFYVLHDQLLLFYIILPRSIVNSVNDKG